jgi:ABC-2 type transport system permease protein
MILCTALIALVVVVEAGPVYRLFLASLHDRPLSAGEWAWIVVSFAAVFVISLAAIFLPMRYGVRQLEQLTS